MATSEMSSRNEKGRAGGVLGSDSGQPSHELVESIQRARLLNAMIEVAAERGYLGASVGHVVARAGMSRRTFYEMFESREDCFLAAFDTGVERAAAALAQGYERERTWRGGVRAALIELLELLDREPALARMCMVEALAAGPLPLERRAEVLRRLARTLEDVATQERRGGREPVLLSAEGIVGGALSVAHTRLLEQRPGSLLELLPQLMALIVLPYLGPRAAGEELRRVPPAPTARTAPPTVEAAPNGLQRLGTRLTYRTVCCLVYIAEHPGTSNRAVAQGAEISDEGQTSKLLARLAGLDLLVNEGGAPGAANAWRLTDKGKQLLHAIPDL
jgi:AcrR family transcriptional regulator